MDLLEGVLSRIAAGVLGFSEVHVLYLATAIPLCFFAPFHRMVVLRWAGDRKGDIPDLKPRCP